MSELAALNDYLRQRNCRYHFNDGAVDVRYEAVSINEDDTVTVVETWYHLPAESSSKE